MSNKKEHYVNNKDFSQAVVDYVTEVDNAKKDKKDIPIVPHYIGECILKICRKLGSRSSFYSYSFKDEMIADAVENCLKAVTNFDKEKALKPGKTHTGITKSQKLNAFSYFSQIAWFAFLRRIQKEEKQYVTKLMFMDQADISGYANVSDDFSDSGSIVNKIRNNTDALNDKEKLDKLIEKYVPKNKKRKKSERKKIERLSKFF